MIWTISLDNKLRELYPKQPVKATARAMNMTLSAVKSRARKIGVCNRKLFTKSEIDFVKKHFSNTQSNKIAGELGKPVYAIYNLAFRLGLKKSEAYLKTPDAGRIQKGERISASTEFRKGLVPANKGKKLCEFMSEDGIKRSTATRFKKGNVPHNAKGHFDGEITIRKCKGRPYKYIRIEIGKWRELHRVMWEKANGKIPKGYNIQFRDGNPLNCVIENMYIISRKKQLQMNNSIHRFPPELKKTIRTLAKLKRKIKIHEEQD
jgi:hypothetical protein